MDVSQIPSDADEWTPSDTATVNGVGFSVGVTGDVAVVTERGTTVTIPSVPAGAQIALRFSKVLNTGTTATGIVVYK